MILHTLQYWRTKEDFDKVEANTLSTDLKLDDAMDVVRAFQRIGRYFAYEIFETVSGETVYES